MGKKSTRTVNRRASVTQAGAARREASETQLSEHAYEAIYSGIVQCELFPGSAVSESELCARYGLGRSPVRHALALLANEGLMTPIPRSGYVVSPMSLATIRQTFQIRAALEGLAAEVAAHNLERGRMRAAGLAYAKAAAQGDPSANITLHNELHSLIYKYSGNEILERMAYKILGQTTRVFYLTMKLGGQPFAVKNVDAHDELIEAIESGDGALARQAAERHIRDSEQEAISRLLSAPMFESMPINPSSG